MFHKPMVVLVNGGSVQIGSLGMGIAAGADERARARLAGVVRQTPLEFNEYLSERWGANIFLKREDRQRVRSFKVRGAYNKIAQLSPARRKMGVVCASAGNHAQGVAYACRELGIHAVIYMPETTPGQKVDQVCLKELDTMGWTRRGTIDVNMVTMETSFEGVFAAGDSVSGTAFVIEAVDSGHTAARSIIRYLQKEHLEPPRKPELPVVHLSGSEIGERLARGEIRRQPRVVPVKIHCTKQNFLAKIDIQINFADA